MAVDCPPGQKAKPEIVGEEDIQFPPATTNPAGEDIATTTRLTLEHKNKVENFKNRTGGILLVACFSIIVAASAVDVCLDVNSSILTGAYEFAKTIATAVIGYLFGTNLNSK